MTTPPTIAEQPQGKAWHNRSAEKVLACTDSGFFSTMFLTAAVSFVVYLYGLKNETEAVARTHAFAVLVFAELLRAFGCRSETKPVAERFSA